MTTSNPQFQMRLVAYTPLDVRGAVIPDLGFTVTSTAAGPTLQATVSTAVYGTLPTNLEVGVEWWHASTKTWTEGRDSRFAITQFDADDRDKTGTVTLTGLGIGAFLLAAAELKGVDAYADTTGTSETAQSKTNVSVSGTTFTWASHVLATGDRVRIVAKGSAKVLSTGSVYFVRNPTASTFQLSRTVSGALINAGTASNINMSRVVTRIVFTDTHQFKKSDSISVLGGTNLGLNDGQQYFVTNPTASTIQVTDKPGGIPIELKAASTNVTQVYRYLDGQRVFTNATPGVVMDAVFLEARNRGWGVGPSDMMTHSWTTGAGTDGVAWTKMADDPATPGISIGFQPGTPGTQVLQALLDNQYAEWYTTGRIISLVNYGTGHDGTADTPPKRIGTTASSVKVLTDLTNMRNAFTVRGTGPILVQQDGTTGPWGRLEVYETAQGATSKSLATQQAKTDLAANQNPSVAYTVTEMAEVAAYIPLVSYSRGDWVSVQLSGTGWTKLRCVGWTFQKAANGAVTVTTSLERVKRTLLSKVAKAQIVTSAGLTSTSTPGSTLQESDNRAPAAPLGVTVSTSGFFGSDSSAESVATVSWNPVVTDINGADVQVVEYDVWLRADGKQYGMSVGRTSGLSLDISPLPSGAYYGVSIRGKSSTGKWGEFCDEVEFQTSFPVLPPNIPTTPTLTSSLAGVRVAWDGTLLDPQSGVGVGPDAGFAYVYVVRGTSAAAITGGTATVVGTNMGNAGYTVDSGLTVGSTYYYALYAVNTVGNISPVSGIASVVVQGVSGPDIAANTVTANNILTGAITSDKLDVGTVPVGSPVNRVPMPLTNTAFWAAQIAQSTFTAGTSVTATANGLVLVASASAGVVQYVVYQTTAVPLSGKLHITGLTTNGTATLVIREVSTTGALTFTTVALTPSGTMFNFQSTTATYTAKVQLAAAAASDTVAYCNIFEVIGVSSTEATEISPDGIRIYSGQNPSPLLALTSSSDDVFALSKGTGDQVASIDTGGNASFASVASSMASFDGVPLVLPSTDPGFADTLSEANPNYGDWSRGDVTNPDGSQAVVALLDRLGRGVIYTTTWPSQNASVIASGIQYQRIAKDVVTLEHGRDYEFNVGTGLLRTNNTSGADQNLRLFLQTTPFTAVAQGTTIMDSIVYAGTHGAWSMIPVVFTAATGQATIDVANRRIPAGVPLYWQLATIGTAAATASWTWNETGSGRGLMIVDLGSSYLTRPATGYDALLDVHDYTSDRAAGTTGGTSTTKTVQATATWSRSWKDGGSTVLNAGGQYANPNALYQGLGNTGEGAQWGFSTSFLSQFAGKTITSAQIYLKNAYMAYSGSGTARISTHNYTAAPASIGSYSGLPNEFNVGWSAGSGKWVSLSSGIRSALSGGTCKGFQIGVSSSGTDYMYFEGVGYGSNPPQLKVTYY